MDADEIINKAMEEGNKEKIKLLITQNDINFTIPQKVKLIKAIGDVGEIIELFEMDGAMYNSTLISGMVSEDNNYKRDLIENRVDYKFNSDDIMLIAISMEDIEYIKKLIEKREEYKLNSYNIAELAITTKDVEYIKELVENREKYKLKSYNITEMAIATKDVKYIKRLIENREEYGLDNHNIIELAIAANDIGYIKDLIQNREKYKLKDRNIIELTIATKDVKYIKDLIENREKRERCKLDNYNITKLAIATKDVEYMKGLIERGGEYELNNYNITELAIATKDVEYIKELIENRKKYELNSDNITELAIATGYIKDLIENRKRYGFTNYEITNMAIATGDVDYIKELIAKRDGYEFSDNDLLVLVVGTKDQGLIDSYIGTEEITDCITLPENITIGIEIESEGRNSGIINKMENLWGWECKEDGSLPNGVEVASPILSGEQEKSSRQIKRVCGILGLFEQYSTGKCGGHIHIGADYLTTPESWDAFKEIHGNCEGILYAISNRTGEIPREGAMGYAKPLSGKMEGSGTQESISISDGDKPSDKLKSLQGGDRYYGINYNNSGGAKNTIEFRMPNGTIEAKTWIENVNLFGGLVKLAEEIGLILRKDETERTEEEKTKLAKFETLKLPNASEEEKMEVLINLAIFGESREIYKERYRVNSKLIQENEVIRKGIDRGIAKKPIVSRRKIGEKVFSGPGGIKCSEYQQIEGCMLIPTKDGPGNGKQGNDGEEIC